MIEQYANAYPRKNFFVQMFTKDISLEDCILDLIDNSIDGLIRTRGLSLSSISKGIFSKNGGKVSLNDMGRIEVSYSENSVEVHDNCGGIDLDYARTEAFNFGHSPGWKERGYLGVYGVGLKRALFKIGNEFYIESKTKKDGFSCHFNVADWLRKEESLDDWRIPLRPIEKSPTAESAGTTIKITDLHEEVKLRLRSGTVDTGLYASIARTYSFFLQNHVSIVLNDKIVKAFKIPIGKPTTGTVSFEELEQNGVKVTIIATLAEPDEMGHYDQEYAGWYIVCNGRVVLRHDKSEISGWGLKPLMPTFQPKYRSFIGVVFFESKDPIQLPWTTDKRNLNKESAIYLRVQNRMATAARPVLSFLNSQYPTEKDEEPIERDISKNIESASFGNLVSKKSTVFNIPKQKKKEEKSTTRVQYDAKNADLEKIRNQLRKPHMGASKVGEYTFNYYLKQEGLS